MNRWPDLNVFSKGGREESACYEKKLCTSVTSCIGSFVRCKRKIGSRHETTFATTKKPRSMRLRGLRGWFGTINQLLARRRRARPRGYLAYNVSFLPLQRIPWKLPTLLWKISRVWPAISVQIFGFSRNEPLPFDSQRYRQWFVRILERERERGEESFSPFRPRFNACRED